MARMDVKRLVAPLNNCGAGRLTTSRDRAPYEVQAGLQSTHASAQYAVAAGVRELHALRHTKTNKKGGTGHRRNTCLKQWGMSWSLSDLVRFFNLTD
jgi:hypothetical protein